MKKFLSLILSIAMLVVLVASALPVYAADATSPLQVQETGVYYDSLKAVFEDTDHNNNEGNTVLVLKDYTETNSVSFKKSTIQSKDSANPATITFQNSGTRFLGISSATNAVTFKDLKIIINATAADGNVGAFYMTSGAVLTFDHVDLTAKNLKLNLFESNWQVATINFTNSSHIVGQWSAGDHYMIAMRNNGSIFNVNVDATSSLSFDSQGALFYAAYGATSSPKAANINIAGTVEVLGTNAASYLLTIDNATTACNVTLESQAQLKLGQTLGSGSVRFVFAKNGGQYEQLHLTDKGASYVLGAGLTGTVAFPTIEKAPDTKPEYFYCEGYALVANGGTYNKTETGEMTFTALESVSSALTNHEGASIRTSDPYGIRFGAKVNAGVFKAMENSDATITDIKIGIVIAKASANLNKDIFKSSDLTADEDYVYYEISIDDLKDGDFNLALYIQNANESNLANYTEALKLKLYGGAYYKIEYNNGTADKIEFATLGTENTQGRSIYDVAQAYKTSAGTVPSFIDKILEVCQ